MASAQFLEEALSNDVDESAVNAIVGSLENQFVTSASSTSAQNIVVNVIQNELINTSSSNSIIGLQKQPVDPNRPVDVKVAQNSTVNNANIQFHNLHSGSQPTFVASVPNITKTNLNSVVKTSEPIKVIYTQTCQPLNNVVTSGRVTFPTVSGTSGGIGINSPLTHNVLQTHNLPTGSVVSSAVNKHSTMHQPLVIKQSTGSGQVAIPPGMVTVPMTVNANMPTSIQNVMTLNKPAGQNVMATSQNMGTAATAQPTIIPGVQIVNMRPGTPGVAAQKSVATVSPRVVIGTPQVVGTRPAAPAITLQTLQGLQPGQQGHLLLKTENGQYQLLRVGPAPSAGALTAPQPQAIRLSSVPTLPGVATASTSMASPQIQTQMPLMPAPVPAAMQATMTMPAQAVPTPGQPTVTTQRGDNTKEKCRNFLANLLDLSSREPKSVERNVRTLIQELIDAQVEPEEFCDRLERLLNASPQPCLIGFLKKSLPLLRQSLVTQELVIEGINPPAAHVAFSNVPAPTQPTIATSSLQMHKPLAGQKSSTATPKTNKPPVTVFSNVPVYSPKVLQRGKSQMASSKMNFMRSTTSTGLQTVLTPGKSLLKDKEKKAAFPPAFPEDKMAGDDDINDVAAMGGVNLAEESQRILGSTELIGQQIRSCKDEYLVSMAQMQLKIRGVATRHSLDEPSGDISAFLSHALQEYLKNIIEKLVDISQHRADLSGKADNRFEITQDVKSQLKFLEDLDRVDKKRREDSEREMLIRAAKSRSKNEDPEQAKLKAKAKEMQRAEMEELRQREANLTALQAIGPRKKPRLEGAAEQASVGAGAQNQAYSGRSQMALRSRLKRINHRDMLCLLEQFRNPRISMILYRAYLK